jgi:hypothetical protein
MDAAQGRWAHLVGSLPAADSRQAMELSLDLLWKWVRTLPDGETGERYQWLVHAIERLRRHPDLELRKDGDWADYDNCPIFKVKRGHTLEAETLDFGQVDAFDEKIGRASCRERV